MPKSKKKYIYYIKIDSFHLKQMERLYNSLYVNNVKKFSENFWPCHIPQITYFHVRINVQYVRWIGRDGILKMENRTEPVPDFSVDIFEFLGSRRFQRYTANIFPVMVTGFPCVHLFPCRPPVPPMGIPCYLMNRAIPVIILHVLHVTCKSLFALRGLTCYHTTSTSICFTDKAVLILQGFSCYSDRQKIVSWTGIWLQI